MTAVTALGTETLEISVHDAALTTLPPSITVSSRAASDTSDFAMRFRRKGRGLAVTEAGSGVVVAWSAPQGMHHHTIAHRGCEWDLNAERSLWGSSRPFRRGFVICPDLGSASIESTYVHYVSEWRSHRRLHRAWTTGIIQLEGDIHAPVLALALRLTLGTHYLELRTGDWAETRREWDFAGF